MRTLVPDANGQVEIDGIKIDWFHSGHGRPLLLLNSADGFTRDLPYIRELAKRFEVIAPQHPGFGHSHMPREFVAIEDLANFYLTLSEHIDLRDAVLVGTSFGGWLAAEIAVRSTERFSRLVLADPLGIRIGTQDTRDITDIFALPPAGAAEFYCWNLASPTGLAGADDKMLRGMARNREALAHFGWRPYMYNPSLLRWLRRISIETLVMRGANDPIINEQYAAAFASEIPHSRFTTVRGAGHYPHLDQPDEFVRLVAEHAK